MYSPIESVPNPLPISSSLPADHVSGVLVCQPLPGPVQIDCRVRMQILLRPPQDFMKLMEMRMRTATLTNEDFIGKIRKDEDMWDPEKNW